MKRINRTLILDLLRREGRLSRSDLAARSGLSLPAVSRAVAELIADGWVTEVGAGASSGGRRPILLEHNPRAGHVVAVDVTPTRILGGVADLAGELVVTATEEPKALGPPLLDQVAGLIARMKEAGRRAAASGYGPLVGVGLAVPGIPDRSGSHVRLAPALQWNDFPVGKTLLERYGCQVLVHNDVDALLLGEQWRGAAVGVRHAVAVYVGAGVGAAVLLDGQLYRGRDGAVGEVGFWLTDPNEKPRSEGFGLLEGRISTAALARRWAAEVGWVQAGPGAEPGRRTEAVGGAAVTPAAEKGDALTALAERAAAGEPATLRLIEETARLIGLLIVNLVDLLNPEVVILGGEVLRLQAQVLPVVNRMVDEYAPFPVKVVPAALGDRSALIGAVYGVIRQQRNSVSYIG